MEFFRVLYLDIIFLLFLNNDNNIKICGLIYLFADNMHNMQSSRLFSDNYRFYDIKILE